MAELALALWLLYVAATLGVSVARQLRRRGKTGLVGHHARRGSLAWLAEVGHEFAIVLGFSAPLLALAGFVEPLEALDTSAAHLAGIALYAAGLIGVVVAQRAMGDSWRIGTDPDERTDLVTDGPFTLVRHPIYSALVVLYLGLALLVPSVIALAASFLFLLAAEGEVRLIEEPHLARLHGQAWANYAGRTGRFLPWIGRERAATTQAPIPDER
jgi:protein-S-isoprenylcysteine O-methyltransferase Ste14